MALGPSIGIRKAVRTAITDADIIIIDDVEFSSEVARRWKHSIVTAAKNIPTKIAGQAGAHRHTYLVKTDAVFTARSGGAAPRPAFSPGALVCTTGVDAVNRVQEHEDHKANLEMFHT